MAEYDFPSKRFQSAGATDAEVGVLVESFDHSDLSMQSSISDFFASCSESALREYLDDLRASGRFATQEPPSVDSGDSAPVDEVMEPESPETTPDEESSPATE